MNRTTLSLIVNTVALAAITGFASLSEPDASGTDTAEAAAVLPVERSGLLCPAPSASDLAETTYTSFTPVTKGAGSDGSAQLQAAPRESTDTAATEDDEKTSEDGKTTDTPDADGSDTDKADTDKADTDKADDDKKTAAKPVLAPKAPGTPVTGETSGADGPALVGTAEGGFAPGWTVQQTTQVTMRQRPRPARRHLHRPRHGVLVPGRQHGGRPHRLRPPHQPRRLRGRRRHRAVRQGRRRRDHGRRGPDDPGALHRADPAVHPHR